MFQTTARKNAMQSDVTVKVTHFSFILTVNLQNLSIVVHPYTQEFANPLYGLEKTRKEPGKDMTKLSNRIAGEIHPRKMQTAHAHGWILRISNNLLRSPKLSADVHLRSVEPSSHPSATRSSGNVILCICTGSYNTISRFGHLSSEQTATGAWGCQGSFLLRAEEW